MSREGSISIYPILKTAFKGKGSGAGLYLAQVLGSIHKTEIGKKKLRQANTRSSLATYWPLAGQSPPGFQHLSPPYLQVGEGGAATSAVMIIPHCIPALAPPLPPHLLFLLLMFLLRSPATAQGTRSQEAGASPTPPALVQPPQHPESQKMPYKDKMPLLDSGLSRRGPGGRAAQGLKYW